MATKAAASRGFAIVLFALSLPPLLIGQMPEQERQEIDQIVGAKGIYIAEEGVYKIVLPREAATVVLDYQTLPSTLGLNSWVAFSPAEHRGALLTGQFLLLEDEADSVISTAIKDNLEITGLADTTVFDGPTLKTLDVSGVGTYQRLATAFRRVLDEIQRIAKTRALRDAKPLRPRVSVDSSPAGGSFRNIGWNGQDSRSRYLMDCATALPRTGSSNWSRTSSSEPAAPFCAKAPRPRWCPS